jgi:hypothetical protein
MAATMALLVFTPLHDILFGSVLGLHDPVKAMAIQAFGIFCLIQLVIALRSEFHGRALLARSTRLMGVASLISLASVLLLCWLLKSIDGLNHSSAAGILVFSFVIEVAVIAVAIRRQ